MPNQTSSHTILASALLAGHVLLTRQHEGWIAQEILPHGRLGDQRTPTLDPTTWAWRGEVSR